MTHPNLMTEWATIGCEHDHGPHATRTVAVDLARRHGYHDWPPIPARLARQFSIDIYDWEAHRDLPAGYCPARDAVSETIDLLGVWEPVETATVLAALTAADRDAVVWDFGAQIGWFTLLAASCGLSVAAVDADPENLRVLAKSVAANGWTDRVHPLETRIGPDTSPLTVELPIALVKIDLEGAEADALRILWPFIERGNVDHLLVEVSPVFIPGDHYPDLVCALIDAGYRAYRLPPKRIPPLRFERFPADLIRVDQLPRATLRALVRDCAQEDYWFARREAPWA